jgi:hypothetical protein
MSIEAMKQALEALDGLSEPYDVLKAQNALRTAIEQAEKQEPVSIKKVAKAHGIDMPERYIPSMDDAVAAGDSVLLNEQAALLRECRFALDEMIKKKPMITGLLCGSTTLGNLRAYLYDHRPQGVFGGAAPAHASNISKKRVDETAKRKHEWVGLPDMQVFELADEHLYGGKNYGILSFYKSIEAKLKEKNT